MRTELHMLRETMLADAEEAKARKLDYQAMESQMYNEKNDLKLELKTIEKRKLIHLYIFGHCRRLIYHRAPRKPCDNGQLEGPARISQREFRD